ncbi:MAG: pro-sigmaK processing inhibitor BofA family protein [Clostridia bacterium]|nr:pro-sigmaK processing inhibitor BofA family protein [Clostridia bacterium]
MEIFMIDSNSAVAYVVGIVIVALIFFLLTKPLKWILKTVFNGLLGGIMLIIINSIGSSIGLMIPINPLNALLVGILGFPGVLLLVLIGLIL